MPTYGSVAANTVGAGTTGNTVTKPTGTVDGDLLLVLCAGNSGGVQTVSHPANGSPGVGDWNAGPSDTSAAWNLSTFWKLAWTSEPANYTFTRAGVTLGNFTVTIARVTGADQSDPIEAAGIAGSGGTANIVLPSLAAAAAGTLLTQMLSQTGTAATTWGAPGGTTKRYEQTSSGAAVPVVGGDQTVGAGPTGTRTWTRSSSGPVKAVVWAINPEPPRSGSAAGSWSVSGAAAGTAPRSGAAAGAWVVDGTAEGETIRTGAAAGSWSTDGSAAGATTRRGAAAGSWSFVGAAEGESARYGAAGGAWSVSGVAAGGSVRSGAAEGSWAFSGAAKGPVPTITGTAHLDPPRWTGSVLSGPPRAAAVTAGRWTSQVERT